MMVKGDKYMKAFLIFVGLTIGFSIGFYCGENVQREVQNLACKAEKQSGYVKVLVSEKDWLEAWERALIQCPEKMKGK